MLVLSRSLNEKIVFPNLGIKIQVLKVSGRRIRLGIDAPPEVAILRDEIAGQAPAVERVEPGPSLKKISEGLRSRLHAASVELRDLHQQLEKGESDDAEANIFRIFRELQSMDDEVAGQCGDKVRVIGETARRALLVDDNKNETHLLASYLRCRRFEVATASNGADAMYYLAHNEAPDFVLLDMLMPKFDGRWTINEIRGIQRYNDLRVFAVSGTHPGEYGIEFGPGGLDGWFRKPLNPESLVSQMFSASDTSLTTAMN